MDFTLPDTALAVYDDGRTVGARYDHAEPGTWTLVVADLVHTFAGPPVKALVLLDDRVAAVGEPGELTDRFRPDRTVEVDGVLVPGFNDAHAHPSMTAENLLHADCSPEVATDEDGLVRQLRGEAAVVGQGQWVIGSRYDHTKTTGDRVVDREFLDRAVPDHPVLLTHVAAHWGVLNSAGLAAARLTRKSTEPPGGALGRNGSGELNGLVYEQALFDLSYPSLARGSTVVPPSTLDARLRGLARAQQMFHAAGITSMVDALCGPDDIALLAEASRTGRLTLRVGMLVAYPHYDRIAALGLHSGFGDERLRLLGVKAFVDGACAGGNCLVEEPFEGTDDHGMQTMGDAELRDLVARVAGDGVVLGVHANGDRAIRKLLDAHERARVLGAPVRRHRIEHCSLIDADIVARIRELGLVVVPFGAYTRFHGDKLVGYYGRDRLERMFAHRTLLDAGIPVAGSSDYPCGPYEPLAAITSCTERRALDGTAIGLSQTITVQSPWPWGTPRRRENDRRGCPPTPSTPLALEAVVQSGAGPALMGCALLPRARRSDSSDPNRTHGQPRREPTPIGRRERGGCKHRWRSPPTRSSRWWPGSPASMWPRPAA